jgi:hypothetical protein
MIEIDPVEVIVEWLKTALTSVDGRVASKHRYGNEWSTDQAGVSVRADGGPFDMDTPVFNQRFEIRIHGTSTAQIKVVHKQLIGLSRVNERFIVQTSEGKALVHYFYPESELSFLYDDEVKLDMGVVFFKSLISEEAVE